MSLILREYSAPWQHNSFSGYLKYRISGVLDLFFPDENQSLMRTAPPPLFGRKDCIEEFLRRILDRTSPTRAAAVIGSPFVGKTSIAQAVFIHPSILERFDNRCYWVSCTKVTSLEAFLDKFIHCLGQQSLLGRFVSRSPFSVQPALDVRHLAVMAALAQMTLPQFVVLDGFEGIWDNNELRDRANQILRDIHSIPHLTLLLTLHGSTAPSVVDWTYHLGPLATKGARELFIYTNPYCADAGLDDLLETVDFNPALVGVLARMGDELKMRPEEMLQEWKDRGIGFLDNVPEEKREFCSSVESSLKSTMESNPVAWKLLRILSMFPCGLPPTELLSITPEIEDIAAVDLPMLDPNLHLLKLHAPMRSYIFQFHHLDDSISDVYSYVFEQCKKRVSRPGDGEFIKNTAYLTTFGSNIEFILTDALDRGCIDAIEAFLDYSVHLCSRRPNEQIVEKAITLARRRQRKELLARCLQCSAEMHRVVNGSAHNEFAEPITTFLEHDDTLRAADCIYDWGLSMIRCGYDGLGKLKQALEMFRTLGDEQREAQCLLSIFQAPEGDCPYDYLHKAKEIFTKFEDQVHIAECLQEEAYILLGQGKVEDGLTMFWDAAEILARVEDGFATASCHRRLGILLHTLGENKVCYELMVHALEMCQTLGRKLDAAFYKRDLAALYWSADDKFDEAINLQESAIPVFWDVDYIFAGAETRLELGMSQIANGDIDSAMLTLMTARSENQRTGIQAAVQISTAFLRLCEEARSDAARLELQQIVRENVSRMTSWVDAEPLLPYLDEEAVRHLQQFK